MSDTIYSTRTIGREVADEDEVIEVLKSATALRQSVTAVGGGSKLDLGNPLDSQDIRLSLARLNSVVDYEPSDLTITVQAAMPLKTLRETLAAKGQGLALDPPDLDNATLAGVMATNVSGPKRLLYGTARDLLIGCRFVLADGSPGKSGGRVVKNVTGYDLQKLLIGSLGTLAVFTELTFKVLPLPGASGWAVASFADPNAALQVARQAARSNLTPAALEVVNVDNGWNLWMCADGMAVAIKNQLVGLAKLAQTGGANDVKQLPTDDSATHWQNLRNRHNAYNLRLRWSSKLTDLPACLAEAQSLAAQVGLSPDFQARAGTGLLYLAAQLAPEQSAALIAALPTARQKVESRGGRLVIEAAPPEIKAAVEVWGTPGDALPALQAVKAQFDPLNLLNPGKMF